MKDEIKEIEVSKVETDFHDLRQYGEYYGIILTFANGRKFTLRMEEHQFEELKLKTMNYEGIKCQSCENLTGTSELHSCPYQADINNDDSEHCNCCNDCSHECAMDI